MFRIVVQEIEEQFHSERLQSEYERRAQERREAVDRSMYSLHMPPSEGVNSISTSSSNERRIVIYPNAPTEPLETLENDYSYTNPAPKYNFQGMCNCVPTSNVYFKFTSNTFLDDQLPSYEEAIGTNNATTV